MNFWKLRLVVTMDQLLAIVVAAIASFTFIPALLGVRVDIDGTTDNHVALQVSLVGLWLTQLYLLWNPSEFTSNKNLFRPASIGRSSIVVSFAVGILAWIGDSLTFFIFGLLFAGLGSILLLVAYVVRRHRLRSSHRSLWIPKDAVLLLDSEDDVSLGDIIRDDVTRLYVNQHSMADNQTTMEVSPSHGGGQEVLTDILDVMGERGISAAFVSRSANWAPKTLSSLISHNQMGGIDSILLTDLGPEAADKVKILLLENETTILISSPSAKSGYRAIKRLLDIVLASLLLTLLWPLMLFIALTIRLDSQGPAVFRSERVGVLGKPFTILKFRTMRNGAHAEHDARSQNHTQHRNGVLFKDFSDDRVTRCGSFLRKSSLDELPQLWNVLRGDMSLVGPRPHLAKEMQSLPPEQLRRLDVKPGITGLWQVNGRSLLSWEEAVGLDLLYVSSRSVWLDITILARTIPAVLSARGAF